jgi:hypothetical protein
MSKPILNLSGIDGNAFVLLGLANKRMRELGYDKEEMDDFREKAMSGNYDNLLRCLNEEFEVVLDETDEDY